MQPLVSIIVPVYKVEDYLEQCLNSLRKQSLAEIEILLVDDASPDQCGAICDDFAAEDKRFRVFHHLQNLGLAEARNTGIRNATCKYVMFVDSDDYVHKDFCKTAYECAVKHQADLVIFNRQRCDASGRLIDIAKNSTSIEMEGYKTKYEALNLIHMCNRVGLVAWNKLYRIELFQKIWYPSGYYHEDWGTTHKLILQANRIYYLDKVMYYWRSRPGSITTLRTKKRLRDLYFMQIQHYRDLETWGYLPIEKTEMLFLSISLFYCIWHTPDMSEVEYVSCAKRLRESDSIPKEFTWQQKVLLFLFRHRPFLFESICRLYGKKVK